MNEIKVKPKNLIIFCIAILILFYLITIGINKKCDIATGDDASSSSSSLLKGGFYGRRGSKTIFAITPTYARPVQKAELTRLAYTILLVPNVHWVIIEDSLNTSNLVSNLLARYRLTKRSTLLSAKTPTNFKLKEKDPNWSKPRGVEQRNAGLEWVRNHLKKHPKLESIVYFMDDDNTYSIELFQQMDRIERGKVGVWPVGLVGGLMVEKPVLNDNNDVIGFNSVWRPERPFSIDMAGFGIHADLLMSYPEAVFSYDVQRGYQESEILRHITVVRDLQPLANQCRDVLVWHTRTETPKLDAEMKLRKEGAPSDMGMEV